MIDLAQCTVKLNIEDRPDEQLQEGYKWIKDIYDNEYEQVRQVRLLLSDEIWNQYLNVDCDDFREVKMLNKALGDLKKRLHGKRPAYFKKGKNASTKEAVKQ